MGAGFSHSLHGLKNEDGVVIRMKDGRFREAKYCSPENLLNKPEEDKKDKYPAIYATGIGFSIEHVEFADKNDIYPLSGDKPLWSESSISMRWDEDVPVNEFAQLLKSKALAIKASNKQDISAAAAELAHQGSVCGVFGRSGTSYINLRGVEDTSEGKDGDKWISKIAAALATNASLLHLGLADLKLGTSGCSAINEMLMTNNTLKSLNLSCNPIGPHIHESKFGEMLGANLALEVLDISGIGLGDDGACKLAEHMRSNKAIKLLIANSNNIADKGGRALAHAIPECALEALEVEENNFPEVEFEKGMKVRVKQGWDNTWKHAKFDHTGDEAYSKYYALVKWSDGSSGVHKYKFCEQEVGTPSVQQLIADTLREKKGEILQFDNDP
eukprot:CAMPEP_0198494882 /NCGR_PEP_ID=MMETSP1462-20131121/4867_1 /TAXON_ID=1333877 /ORGANISM="Brandtodinium nutriculum, Strain RCC3387" /LENGTH=385 /DNA_ID=CAMNT_0044223631 /DNA_START=129 /DNA_END=1282 /DNA_ORIENTATION=+